MDYTSTAHFVNQIRSGQLPPLGSLTAQAARTVLEREQARILREHEKRLMRAQEQELARQRLREECETLLLKLYVLEGRYYRHDMHRPVHEWGTPSIPADIEKAARAYTNAVAQLQRNERQ